jgi:hypothetical protein
MWAKDLQTAPMAKKQLSTAKQSKSLWRLGGLTPWQLVHNVFEEIMAMTGNSEVIPLCP